MAESVFPKEWRPFSGCAKATRHRGYRDAIPRRSSHQASRTIRLTHIAFAAALLVSAAAARAACSPVGGNGSISPGVAGGLTSVTCSGPITTGAGQG